MPQERVILRWSAYEHEHIERERDWYIALAIATIAIAIIAILFDDLLFAVVIIAAAFVIALLANTPPELAQFEISERGVRINSRLHRYHEIISFWVEDEHHADRPILLIDTTKFMVPNLVIPIEDIEPRVVRAYLKEHAKEAPMQEPVAHKILEFFGL